MSTRVCQEMGAWDLHTGYVMPVDALCARFYHRSALGLSRVMLSSYHGSQGRERERGRVRSITA
jgi:hypothetical protein